MKYDWHHIHNLDLMSISRAFMGQILGDQHRDQGRGNDPADVGVVSARRSHHAGGRLCLRGQWRPRERFR